MNKYQPKKIQPTSLWQTIFFKNSGGISSKRLCGFAGWCVCLIVFISAFIMQKDIPDFSDMVIITSASLLGVDSITSIFTKSINK